MTWLDVAEAIWKQGFFDKHSLQRQRQLLTSVADTTNRLPDEVDFDGTVCMVSYIGKNNPDRRISFRFFRLGGAAKIVVDCGIDEASNSFASSTATPVNVERAIDWLDAELVKAKVAKTRKKKNV